MKSKNLIRNLQQDALLASLLLGADANKAKHYIHIERLAQIDFLDDLLNKFASTMGKAQADKRAIASLWSRWYFWVVLPPIISALVIYQYLPKVYSVLLNHEYKACGFCWYENVDNVDPSNENNLIKASESFVKDHELLVNVLAKLSGISTKVLWNNFGNMLEYVISGLRTHPRANHKSIQVFQDLMTKYLFTDHSPNPIREPVRYVTDPSTNATNKIRKICCLEYLFPGTDLCSNCPRPR